LNVRDLIKEVVACTPYIVDVGCGRGGATCTVSSICRGSYVVGIDVECGLVREACPELPADFVCGDVSTAPFRNGSFTEALAFLTLHEVRGDVAESLRGVRRVLRGVFVVVDKYLARDLSPPQALTLLTEEAYHKALRYALGIRVWGSGPWGRLLRPHHQRVSGSLRLGCWRSVSGWLGRSSLSGWVGIR